MNNNHERGNLLSELRKRNNFSPRDISSIIGVSKPAISKWENGEDIKTENLYKLAKLYGVKASELYHGKMTDETNAQYCKRNFELTSEIDEDSIEDLFKKVKSIKTTFINLLSKWANSELYGDELEIFVYLKKYYDFDTGYFAEKTNCKFCRYTVENERLFVKSIYDKFSTQDDDAYLWEMNKLYDFNFDFSKLIKSNNLKVLECLLSTLLKPEKDEILENALTYEKQEIIDSNFDEVERSESVENYDRIFEKKSRGFYNREYVKDCEIEKIPYFKIIINSGAKLLKDSKYLANIERRYHQMDPEAYNFTDGKKKELKSFEINEVDEDVDFNQRLFGWKQYSYIEYLDKVAEEETNRLSDIVNLRNDNPYKYYLNMIERDKY